MTSKTQREINIAVHEAMGPPLRDICALLERIAEALERGNRADIERAITEATGRPANLSKGE